MVMNGTYGDQITLKVAANLYNIEIVVVSTLGPDATAVISPSSSIPTATVQLGNYADNHGEHYICVDGRVLLEEEQQEKKANGEVEEVEDDEQEERAEEEVEDDEQDERAEEEVEDDGEDLLSTQEDDTHGQYMGKEKEMLEQDQHGIQIPIPLLETRPLKWFPRTTLPHP